MSLLNYTNKYNTVVVEKQVSFIQRTWESEKESARGKSNFFPGKYSLIQRNHERGILTGKGRFLSFAVF